MAMKQPTAPKSQSPRYHPKRYSPEAILDKSLMPPFWQLHRARLTNSCSLVSIGCAAHYPAMPDEPRPTITWRGVLVFFVVRLIVGSFAKCYRDKRDASVSCGVTSCRDS